jgi:hypothetical protein
MLIRQAMNEGVVRYLERLSRSHGMSDIRRPREQHLDYWECGSHPDVVERVWDQLGKHLPAESRQVVLGTPALIHPGYGVVLAIAIGTQYALRLPHHIVEQGLPDGTRTQNTWSTGDQMDIQQELGKDWVFGTWASAEEDWCLEAFREQQPRGT